MTPMPTKLDPPVLAALVAAGASLVVCIAGLVTSLATSRKSNRATRELELLKQDFERSKSRDQFLDARLSESLKSLAAAIQSIQAVKDAIQLVLSSAADSSLDVSSALRALSDARDQQWASHREHMSFLSELEVKALHRAKDIARFIEAGTRADLSGKNSLSELSSGLREQLLEFRNELTERQQILRDSMNGRLAARLAGSD